MSTVSASAATIFDLVIGFAIDSILQWAVRGAAARTPSKKERHSTWGVTRGVNRIRGPRYGGIPVSGAGGMGQGVAGPGARTGNSAPPRRPEASPSRGTGSQPRRAAAPALTFGAA